VEEEELSKFIKAVGGLGGGGKEPFLSNSEGGFSGS